MTVPHASSLPHPAGRPRASPRHAGSRARAGCASRSTRPTKRSCCGYQQGDRGAFPVLVRRHPAGAAFNSCLSGRRVPQLAEDVVLETSVRVVHNAAEFKHEARFTTWLYTITRNLCIDQPQEGRAPQASFVLDQSGASSGGGDGDGPTLGELTADPRASVEREEATGSELKERIARPWTSSRRSARGVSDAGVSLTCPFKEIAEITNVPENTVKSRMRYALERLQERSPEYEDYARGAPG